MLKTAPDLQLVAAPTALPIELDQLKLNIDVDFPGRDNVLETMLRAAVRYFDGKDGVIFHCLMPQRWTQYFGRFPAGAASAALLPLPLGPVREIVSVGYVDSDGADQVLDEEVYEFCPATGGSTAFLRLKTDQVWPSTACQARAVAVTYAAGYADAASVPEDLIVAICLKVRDLFEGVTANKDAIDDMVSTFRPRRI